MKSIKIDRLDIRLKGISPQVARSLAAGLGNEISKQLANQHSFLNEKGLINISKIDSGVFQTSKVSRSLELQRMIADRIVGSITSKTKSQTQQKG